MPRIELKNVTKRFDKFVAVDNLNMVIEDRDFITLLGPSGCGKTTTLRMIAGLETPTEGEIVIGDTIVFSSEKGINITPDKRDVGFLFQNYALWPHMTVKQNIAFGLENLKWPKEEIVARVQELLVMMKIESFGHRYPSELSGGQQQRVAIARTLATRPKVLFMDEPLSNLDAKLREKVRVEIREVQQKLGITAVYVTHDQAEALAISDVIISMNKGVIQQIASPREIYDNPTKRFVADFIGIANHLQGEIVTKNGKNCTVSSDFGVLTSTDMVDGVNGPVVDVSWRPEDMILLKDDEKPENCNIISGLVSHSVYMGNMLDIFFKHKDVMYRANVDKDNHIKEGTTIRFAVAFDKLHVMEAE